MDIFEVVQNSTEPINQQNYTDTDAAVLAYLSYIRVEDLNLKNPVTIRQAMEDFLASNTGSEDQRKLAQVLIDSPRYRDLELVDYASNYSTNRTEQFAAQTYRLPDGTCVIAYRGTDGTSVGWHEDFLLLYEQQVDAQKSAAEYVQRIAEQYPDADIYITGHSKGGMLADYAGVSADPEIQERIQRVVNLDGPGIFWDVHDQLQDGYDRMRDKMIVYAPEDSIIGQLLHNHENQVFVKSDAFLIMQHDLASWQFNQDGTVQEGSQTAVSKYLDSLLDRAVQDMPYEQRKNFINAVFLFVTKGSGYSGDMFKDFKDDLNDGRYLDFVADIVDCFHDMTLEEKGAFAATLAKILLIGCKDFTEYVISLDPILEKAVEIGREFLVDQFQRLDQWLDSTVIGRKFKAALQEIGTFCLQKVKEAAADFFQFCYNLTHRYQDYQPGDTIRLYHSVIEDAASALSSIQNSIVRVDDEMNSLRRNQEWYEIFNKAAIGAIDFLFVGFDRDVRDCMNYLSDLSQMFKECERELEADADQFA